MSEEILPVTAEEVEPYLVQGIELLREMNIDREYEKTFDFGNGLLYTCSLVLSMTNIKVAMISNELGLYHARNGKFGYAHFFLYSAIRFWQQNPELICEDTVNTYIHLGIAYTLDPSFALGKETFRNAHLVLKRINAEKSVKAAEVLCFEAQLYMTQEDWATALELLQQSLDMLAGLGVQEVYFKGECLLHIAKIYRYQKKIMDALTYYQMAVAAYFEYFKPGHSIIDPVLEEFQNCLEMYKEEKGSEILEFGSENN